MTNLPPFQGYGAGINERIHHKHQAIIPTYKLGCRGNIIEWGVDLNPVYGQTNQHTFNFDLQVWRPSPTVNESGCYSLVDNFMVTSLLSERITVTSNHVARVTPSPQDQLQFQPGDVLGFYVESQGTVGTNHDNGVALLVSGSYTSELVWHASVSSHTVSGSCPYPVGTDGVLRTSTRAAPVISIATLVYSCPQSPSLSMSISAHLSLEEYPATASNPSASTVSIALHAISTDAVELNINNTPLITGAVVAFLVLCTLLIIMIIATTTLVRKRRVVEILPPVNEIVAETNFAYAVVGPGTKRNIDTEVNPAYEEAGSRIETKACSPSYEQVGTLTMPSVEMEANPSYEQLSQSK